MWRILYVIIPMSCCGGCGGSITQIVRETGVCCPTLDLANQTATLVDADGNTLTIGGDGTAPTVTLALAGDQLTVGVNGIEATTTLTLPGVPDVLTSLVYDMANGILTYQDEEGNPTNIDLSALVNVAETNTTIAYDAGTNQLTYTPENGVPQVLDLSGLGAETLTTLVLQGDVLDYTDEDGVLTQIDLSGFRETNTTLAFDPNTSILTYTDETGANIPIDLSPLEHVTTLAFDTATNQLTYTNENNVANIIDLSVLNVLTTIAYDPATSIITYRAEDGNPTQLDLSGLVETQTTLVFNPANSTLIYTPEDGNPVNLDLSSLIPVATANSPTVTLAGDGTAATPLTATAVISAQAGNIVQAVADGLFAQAPPVNATLEIPNGTTDLNLLIDGNIVSTVDLRTAATVILTDNMGAQVGRLLPV